MFGVLYIMYVNLLLEYNCSKDQLKMRPIERMYVKTLLIIFRNYIGMHSHLH